MAAIDDLVSQIEDVELRSRIQNEINKLTKQKKFGLVFENHLTECTPLFDMPIKKNSLVALKTGKVSDNYVVIKINGNTATCVKRNDKECVKEFEIDDLICVAEFGDPIYPYLKPIDSICNAPDSNLWHTLIEADNYHALQLLEYLYAGKVDCIYIDPPYNTGAKDWKYNNDYVDGSDAYRHSKWLSFMKKRLKLAKKLLNPTSSVLIVAIDEWEFNHLGLLLDELFHGCKIQMISVTNNPKGRATDYFTRIDEYLYYVFIGEAKVTPINIDKERKEVRWPYLKRSDSDSVRGKRPRQFYPIYIDDKTKKIKKIGEPLSPDIGRFTVDNEIGCTTVFPVNEDGTEMEWGLTKETLQKLYDNGFVKVGAKRNNHPMPYSISYLSTADLRRLENGELILAGENKDGTKIVINERGKKSRASTVWVDGLNDAGSYGKSILGNILPKRNFPFPKSLYAVYSSIKNVTKEKRDALILDFFAGSGTTLHAVNLLNAEDEGHRRCICVTNNEVSEAEAKSLTKKGLKPGDEEWESLGIARYVTWPRTVCSIEGHDINGNPLKGNYIGSDKPMAEGFKSNAVFFKLGFLNKTSVALGRQFKELLPVLWIKAGAIGECPVLDEYEGLGMLIYPKNKMAILINESSFNDFVENLKQYDDIKTIFIVTDSNDGYKEMISYFKDKDTYQLYRDYLDNFRINTSRG